MKFIKITLIKMFDSMAATVTLLRREACNIYCKM